MIELVSEIVTAVVMIATVIAKLTPSPKDDEKVGKVKSYLLIILRFLPTFGVNPQTKRLMESIKESKKDEVS